MAQTIVTKLSRFGLYNMDKYLISKAIISGQEVGLSSNRFDNKLDFIDRAIEIFGNVDIVDEMEVLLGVEITEPNKKVIEVILSNSHMFKIGEFDILVEGDKEDCEKLLSGFNAEYMYKTPDVSLLDV